MDNGKARQLGGYIASLIMLIGGGYLIWINIQKGGCAGIGLGVILITVAGIMAYLITPIDADKRVLRKIEEFPPELQPQVLKMYEAFRPNHPGLFLKILEKAKGNVNEVERISKVVQDSNFDARTFWDEVG